MLFNSLDFIVFIIVLFILYWFVFNKDLKKQNTLILLASYFFYGWWDIRFLGLIILSTLVDFICGIKIDKASSKNLKKKYLAISLFSNLLILFTFKYFNFFIDSFKDIYLSITNLTVGIQNIDIILPVGISFYTFQTMSYSIDIYNDKLKPTKDLVSFSAFVAFFPQLVAGPIERASNLLPQLLSRRKFNYEQGFEGIRLIIWGLFKKVVVADNLAQSVNKIFENYSDYNGGELFLGAFYFSFQIYCDFSGYSDIAIGTSKLLGVELKSNFKFPYFSKNIAEFWRRWHISLSTWFRDYIYIPIGGSKVRNIVKYRNLLVIFSISGLWHGANLTFVFWGFSHCLIYIMSEYIINNSFRFKNNLQKLFYEFTSGIITFIIIVFTWIFFRSETIFDAFSYIKFIFYKFDMPMAFRKDILVVLFFVFLEFLIRKNERNIQFSSYKVLNTLFFFFLYLVIISQSVNQSEFIYFKF